MVCFSARIVNFHIIVVPASREWQILPNGCSIRTIHQCIPKYWFSTAMRTWTCGILDYHISVQMSPCTSKNRDVAHIIKH